MKKINMKIKRNRPLAYAIYDFLKENAVGYENRIKSYELMQLFNIKSNEVLRSYIQEIRASETLQKIICSEPSQTGGYWIPTNDEEVEKTLKHLYGRAINMLKTYSTIKKKCNMNNQLRLKLSKYEKDIFESIMEVENDDTQKYLF